jgi:hypothetical protein
VAEKSKRFVKIGASVVGELVRSARDIAQKSLIAPTAVGGIGLFEQAEQQADESSTGPASLMIADPDGGTILVDQHV